MKKLKINHLVALVISTLGYSQVGIGTQNPIGTFHMDALSNNNTTSNTKHLDDLIVTASGNIGLGTTSPKVKLDLRSDGDENSLGLGNTSDTDLTANNAKAGAVKYYYASDTDKGIKYSDGTNWNKRASTHVKALVFARKGTAQTISANTQTNITGWSEEIDRTNSYSNDVFTAPRTNIYMVTLNLALQSNTIANDSTIEIILNSNSTTGIPSFRCVYSFPGTGTNAVSNVVSGSCTGIFYLTAGNTIRPQIIQNVGGTSTRTILNDTSYNTISITEL